MDMLLIRDPHGLKISPDGRYVAFVVGQAVFDTDSYRSALFVIGTAPGSVPLNLGSAGAPEWSHIGEWLPVSLAWSPDSRYIACLVKQNGTRQVWRWNREGGAPVQLTHNAYDVQDFEWSQDVRRITYRVQKPITRDEEANLERKGILYDGLIHPWELKPIVDQKLEREPHQGEDWVSDVATGRDRRASAAESTKPGDWKSKLGDEVYDRREALKGKRGRIRNPKLSPDRKRVVYKVRTDPGGAHVGGSDALYVKSLDVGGEIPLRIGAYSIADYQWSHDGNRVFYTEIPGTGHSPQLFAISPSGGQPQRLGDGNLAGSLDEFSIDDASAYAACTYSTNTVPTQIALLDLRTGSLRILADLNPEFQNFELSPATRLDWKNKYGDRGHAYLVKPLNPEPGQRYPLIVTTYRSGDYFLRGGVGDEYPIQVFAAHGFAVLAFDIGRDDPVVKPGDFETVMRRYRSPLASFETALSILDKTGEIDSNRRGLTGLSFGAEISEFAVSHSELFQALITSGGGARDPGFYYIAGKEWRRIFGTWGLGLPDGPSAKDWHEMSPALNVDHVKAPWLLNAAETEYICNLQLTTSLEASNKPYELFIYPNALHIKNQPKHRYEIYERNLDWFRFWLQDYEDPDPAKAEQYKRWRDLRKLQEQNAGKAPPQSPN